MGRSAVEASRSPGRRGRHKHKAKDRARDRDRDRERPRDRHKDKKERDKEQDRRERERRDRDRQRDRERKDRDRHKDDDRPRRADRDSRKDRSLSRERRERGRGNDSSDRDKHRSKRERDGLRQDEVHEAKRRREDSSKAEADADLQKKEKEEEAAQLDAEMDKRRKRVEVWQAQRRKIQEDKEEELKKLEEASKGKKKWSLEDDDDDDDMELDAGANVKPGENGTTVGDGGAVKGHDKKAQQGGGTGDNGVDDDDDGVDPLEAFMANEILPQVDIDVKEAIQAGKEAEAEAEATRAEEGEGDQGMPDADKVEGEQKKKVFNPYDSDTSDIWEEEEVEEEDDEEWFKSVQSGKLTKGDRLAQIDHSQMNYASFRRSFYIEVPELSKMTEEELAELRKELDGIKVRGKDIPKPVKTWTQCGLSSRVLDLLKKSNFQRPLPIQAQALPIIMSGRDCIGIAKTGSGKTLAFVLPMLRHIKDQPPLESGDGPIGIIMAPTRELVQQIGKEAKRFSRVLDLNTVCVFGGSGVANQISDLKRGCEIVVCTPGRMIDLLVTSNGKITNLRRVTYLVLDEADRMFDMGFEPQIMRIVNNIRLDRQTVMFSATFPRQVELIARKILEDPVEILVGGRSVVNSDITQFVEIRPEEERFFRLLEILGEWYEKGKIIIFVNSQDKCDTLFRDLLRHGYPCLSLHGGKEQTDRESTIADFKGNVCNVLAATSVAARGLDVKELVLVVNYDVPNHHEDYVHRVGRTGRAGNKGTAITFIAEEEEKYAPDLVKALKDSKAPIPQDIQKLADSFNQKRRQGLAQGHGSGYGGSGFKFDEDEEDKRKAARKAVAKEYGLGEDESEDDDNDLDARPAGAGQSDVVKQAISAAQATAASMANAGPNAANGTVDPAIQNLPQVQAAHQLAARLTAQAQSGGGPSSAVHAVNLASLHSQTAQQPQAPDNPILAAAKAAAGQIAAKVGIPTMPSSSAGGNTAAARAAALAFEYASQHGAVPQVEQVQHFEAELEINDFPQHARWKITHRDTLSQVTELTGAAITTRGQYYKPGTAVPPGERKLFLLIEGSSESSIRKAKTELKKILAETTEKVMRRDAPTGKYSIM